jgi:hypothetical protein
MVRPTSGWGAVRANWGPRVLGMNQGARKTVTGIFRPDGWKPVVSSKWPQSPPSVQGAHSPPGMPQGTRPGAPGGNKHGR